MFNMTKGDRIRQLRKKLGMTQDELAAKVKTTKQTIFKYECDIITNIPSDKIELLSKALETTPTYIMGWDDRPLTKANIATQTIPLYSSICCGDGGFNDDNILDYVSVPSQKLAPSRQYFAQYAKGDSMNGVGIDDGDLLVFELTSQIDSGQIGSFCIDENEATCKKFTIQNNLIILQPANSQYDPIIIDPTNQHFRCVGRLILSIKNFE